MFRGQAVVGVRSESAKILWDPGSADIHVYAFADPTETRFVQWAVPDLRRLRAVWADADRRRQLQANDGAMTRKYTLSDWLTASSSSSTDRQRNSAVPTISPESTTSPTSAPGTTRAAPGCRWRTAPPVGVGRREEAPTGRRPCGCHGIRAAARPLLTTTSGCAQCGHGGAEPVGGTLTRGKRNIVESRVLPLGVETQTAKPIDCRPTASTPSSEE